MMQENTALAFDEEQDIDDQPESALITIGQILQKKRKQMKLTLDHVSEKTCIRHLYLDALEKGDAERLPVASYTIGFMKSYAHLVDVDLTDLIVQFKAEVGEETLAPHLYANHDEKNKGFFRKYLFNFKTVVFFSVMGCIKLYVIWFLVSPLVPSDESIQTSSAEEFAQDYGLALPEATAAAQPETPVQAENVAPVVAEVAAEPTPKPSVNPLVPSFTGVVLKAKEDCWIQVSSSEKVIFQGLLLKGQTYTVPKQEGLTLTAGNAPVLEISVDGKVLKPFQSGGKVLKNIDLNGQKLIKRLGHR